jgi:ATP-dependent protease ClpP protease subunit
MQNDYIKLLPYALKGTDLQGVMPTVDACRYFEQAPVCCNKKPVSNVMFASDYETESYLPMGVIVAKSDKSAVHFLQGGIYDYTSRDLEASMLLADGVVDRHVLYINSGGGEVEAMWRIINAISMMQKPVDAYVTGGAYSAAQIIALHCRKVYAENNRTGLGSIGVMSIFEGYKKDFEGDGYVVRRLYATKSTKKNEVYESAIAGQTDLAIANLDKSMQEVESSIIAKRPTLADSEYFAGRDCQASECENILFDGYADLMSVVFPENEETIDDKEKKITGIDAAAANAVLNQKEKKMELTELIKAAKYAENAPVATAAFLLSGATELTAEYLQAVSAEVLKNAVEKQEAEAKGAVLQAAQASAVTAKAAAAPAAQLTALDKVMAAKFGEAFVLKMHEDTSKNL